MAMRPHRTPVAALFGGSAPAAYTCGAVVFDGATQLGIASLTATENAFMMFSVWLLLPNANIFTKAVFVCDPDNQYRPLFNGTFEDGKLAYTAGNAEGDVEVTYTNSPGVTAAAWHNFLGAITLAGVPTGKLYVDDVDVGSASDLFGSGGTVSVNGLSFYVANDTFDAYLPAHMADLWIAPGQYLDLSVEANRRKFISATGKPVNLGAAGATPTGTAPAMFFHVAHAGTPSDFGTNLGTGGAFTLGGGVTQTGALVNTSADVVMADVTGITVGAFITVTGVPAGTTVLSINVLIVTMSAPATASNAAASIKFGGVLRLAPSSPSD